MVTSIHRGYSSLDIVTLRDMHIKLILAALLTRNARVQAHYSWKACVQRRTTTRDTVHSAHTNKAQICQELKKESMQRNA